MPITAANGAAGVLDFKSALNVLESDYRRDGLDAKSLLDSDKRGGLT
jgi:IMP dehydrogenase